jgi:hypothetical protein
MIDMSTQAEQGHVQQCVGVRVADTSEDIDIFLEFFQTLLVRTPKRCSSSTT